MGFASQSTQQQFPYNADFVFDVLEKAVENVGMSIKESDRSLRRATVSVGMSLFSWGENVSISVNKIDDESSVVAMDSSLKFGASVAGSHKHQKNFDKIIYSLSNVLKELHPK
ncbi:hypothetical protein [Yersinia pekkanenii]|uniref:DUF1499 domain-containing protein n=1 Tax=Yersinia pekkanenii TaxID=1288385 RepID=A0A0T9QCE0_9GAMM|nr:hypothetical protein [Yersinia pekkanenii]CNI05446.1 Uncharacterised protein [Yersinia pekkanenii]CRY68786.1 Uncharacterised protein [Yersinia pekkanenii]